MEERSIRVPGLCNARDLGGLPRVGGGTTPRGVLLRSESPDLVTAGGWDPLRGIGVRTVIDLRRPDERARDTGARPAWAAVLHLDLNDLRFTQRYGAEGLEGASLHHLDRLRESPEAVLDVLRAVGEARPGAVLIHCVGGRDRTGLLAAILLAVAGVEGEAIVADHLETVANAPRLARAQGVPNWEPHVERLLARHGTSTEAAFRAFLAGLDVGQLLDALTPEQAEAVRTWRGTLPRRTHDDG